MMTAFYHSFDFNANSDSEDDFMVDSIIPENNNNYVYRKNCVNKNQCQKFPSIEHEDSFPSFLKMATQPSQILSCKLPIKRNIRNVPIDYCSKLLKFQTDEGRNSRQRSRPQYQCVLHNNNDNNNNNPRRNQDSVSSVDVYECNSNIPSPSISSDRSQSIESSSTCTLNDDPIITSVILNDDKKFNYHEHTSRFSPNESYFNDLPMSFDKSRYSTSIDDNLLRPIRQKQFINKDSMAKSNNVVFINKNHSVRNSWYKNIAKVKRCRSIGLDDHCLFEESKTRSGVIYPIKLSSTSLQTPPENSSNKIHSSINATVAISLKKLSQTTGHNKRKHLLQFIIDLLKDGNTCVNWSNEKEKEFFISQPEKLALLWATYKKNNRMTFDSLARSLRLYYAPKKLERISGKKNHYRLLNMSNDVQLNENNISSQ